jgi:hypothetical protein
MNSINKLWWSFGGMTNDRENQSTERKHFPFLTTNHTWKESESNPGLHNYESEPKCLNCSVVFRPFNYTGVEFRLWDLNGPTGGRITGCRIMRKWERNKRKVNGSTLGVQIWFINNHSAVPLTQYNTELIWVNELRWTKLSVADSSVCTVYSACLLGMRVLCVVRYRSLQRADQSFRGVLPSFVCPSVIKKFHGGGLGPLWLSNHEIKKTDRGDCHVRGACEHTKL